MHAAFQRAVKAGYQDDKADAKKLAAKDPMDYETALAGYAKAEASLQELSSSARKALAACNEALHADCTIVLNNLIRTVLPAQERPQHCQTGLHRRRQGGGRPGQGARRQPAGDDHGRIAERGETAR